MFKDLFERIINAVKPRPETEHADSAGEQVSEASQPWHESSPEQPESSQEPSTGFQEQASSTQPNEWQE